MHSEMTLLNAFTIIMICTGLIYTPTQVWGHQNNIKDSLRGYNYGPYSFRR